MQRINYEAFWKRYGREKWEETEFYFNLKATLTVSKDGPWIAGGSVRRQITGMKQESDYDFFFKTEEQMLTCLEELKAKKAKVNSESEFNIDILMPVEGGDPIKVQFIKVSFFESLEKCLESFDFSLCQCGFDGTDFVFGDYTLFDLANKRIVPGKISYGVSSIRRLIKYSKQGYSVCGGGLTEMLEQIANDPKIINGKIQYID
jgi:hypothetical protein